MNYFLQDEGIVEMSMIELEHFAKTGEYLESVGIFEFDGFKAPGTKFCNKYVIKERSLLLTKDFLSRKYGEIYKEDCLRCRIASQNMEWVEAHGIVIATLDFSHILAIETTITPYIYEEDYIVLAFLCRHAFDNIEFPNEKKQEEERDVLLKYWDNRYEKKAVEMFKSKK